jgi:hypothetical protein
VSESRHSKQKAIIEKNSYTSATDKSIAIVYRRDIVKYTLKHTASSDFSISTYIPRRRRFESRDTSQVVSPCSSSHIGQNVWPVAQRGHFLSGTASVKPPTDPTYVGARCSVHIFSSEAVSLRACYQYFDHPVQNSLHGTARAGLVSPLSWATMVAHGRTLYQNSSITKF